jgi:hypothetical protein
MSFPDTSNVGAVFIQDSPDFNKPITVTTDFRTTSFTARGGGEQRSRRRLRPRYSINYMLTALNLAAFTLRRANTLLELQAPIVIPIWTHPYTLSSMSDANTAALGLALASKKFKVGSYAYFVQTGKVSTFRLITAVNSTSLSLHATTAYPTGTIPGFTAGALVYPCILGRRTDDASTFTLSRVTQTDEMIAAEEL